MADLEYLFIHPLMGTDDTSSGFIVEAAACGKIKEEMLQILMQHAEFAGFDHRHPWFFPVHCQSGWLESTLEHVTPTFPAQVTTGVDEDALKMLEANLRQHKVRLALRASPSQKLPGTGAWDYVLITASHARTLPAHSLLELSPKTTIVVTDVHNHADREWATNNSAQMTTTEFLLNRHPPGKKADLTRLKLVQLLALIAANADTSSIEDIFRQELKLAYSLLRLVNSAANAPRSPITSFSQAINLLGRRQLQRWLQLLIFADQNSGQHINPLLQKAATRGRLMELLAEEVEGVKTPELKDAAFMIGAFSLLDVLLNMSIKEILQHLPLASIVHDALADHSGPLGQFLKMITATESRDLAAARNELLKLSIAPEKHLNAQLTALGWATQISRQT